MKYKSMRIAAVCGVLAVGLGLGGVMTSCGAPQPKPGVVEGETLPDLTDGRVMTSVEPYLSAVETAFADTEPVSADVLTYEEVQNGVMITGYTGDGGVVMLPNEIHGMPVVTIQDKAFANQTALSALYIPDSVTTMGRGALEGCTGLTALRTPVATAQNTAADASGAYGYSFGAIFGASDHTSNGGKVPASLKILILGEGVTEIPAYAFYACNDLTCIDFPATLTSVGDFAFYGCAALSLADLSATSLTCVGEYAFGNCASLLQCHLPATVTEIGCGAVKGCGSLETMTLPFVGGTIGESRYLGFLFGATEYTLTEGHMPVSLQAVTLLEGCAAVPENAFFGCSYIREIYLPSTIQEVGHRAFYGCARLTALTLPDGVTAVGNEALAHCERLQTVDLGEGLTTLGVQAFMRCLSLKNVTVPNSLTAIPASCFAGCISLETVTAGGVTSAAQVGAQAYRGCDKLIDAPFRPVETDTETE